MEDVLTHEESAEWKRLTDLIEVQEAVIADAQKAMNALLASAFLRFLQPGKWAVSTSTDYLEPVDNDTARRMSALLREANRLDWNDYITLWEHTSAILFLYFTDGKLRLHLSMSERKNADKPPVFPLDIDMASAWRATVAAEIRRLKAEARVAQEKVDGLTKKLAHFQKDGTV